MGTRKTTLFPFPATVVLFRSTLVWPLVATLRMKKCGTMLVLVGGYE